MSQLERGLLACLGDMALLLDEPGDGEESNSRDLFEDPVSFLHRSRHIHNKLRSCDQNRLIRLRGD